MKQRESVKRKIILIVVSVVMCLYSVTMLMPIYFMIVNSFKLAGEFSENVWSIPRKFYFGNYTNVTKLSVGDVSIVTMYINSIILTISATLIATAATIVTAYVVAKFNFRGKNFLVAIAVGAMLIPDLGSQATIYKLFVDMHIIDTWFILIKFASPFGMMFLIAYGLFRTVSGSYAEAAKMDGASELRIFLQIMVPMAKGVIGMMLVMTAIGCWNDYYTSYMYLPTMKTLALGLQEIAAEAQTYGNFTELYAAMVIAVTPLIILFICMRDVIINNAVAGGLKG